MVSVESNNFDSTDIMLIIERLVNNGIISFHEKVMLVRKPVVFLKILLS